MKRLTARMTPRERFLSTAVATVVFVLLNIVVAGGLLKKQARLRAELAQKTSDLRLMQTLFEERELWSKRDAWLQEKQPKLTNEGSAGVDLLDEIKAVAKANDLPPLENPQIGALTKTPLYHSVAVTCEAKCPWPALIAFLTAMQQPERFLVFESANIQIDPGDPSLIRGRFRIARS